MLKKPDPSKKSKGVGVGDVSIRTALFTACLFQHDLPFFLAWKVFYYLTLVPPALQKLSVRHAAARVFLEEYQEKVKAVEESIQVLQNLNFKCPISLRSMVVGIFLGIAYAVVTWVVTYFSSNASLARFLDDAALPKRFDFVSRNAAINSWRSRGEHGPPPCSPCIQSMYFLLSMVLYSHGEYASIHFSAVPDAAWRSKRFGAIRKWLPYLAGPYSE